jgi:predicted nucleic acid-binding protein
VGSLTLPATGPVGVDAQIIIYTVESHTTYNPLLDPLWQALLAGTAEVVTCELSLMESLVGPIKTADAGRRQEFEDFFQKSGVRLEPISTAILRRAAELRATTRLRTPDAIHAATALLTGCALFLTNDRGFRGVAGLPVQILDDLRTP